MWIVMGTFLGLAIPLATGALLVTAALTAYLSVSAVVRHPVVRQLMFTILVLFSMSLAIFSLIAATINGTAYPMAAALMIGVAFFVACSQFMLSLLFGALAKLQHRIR